ncbi:MAG: 4Fe-4S binding protein [candidate division Zixibacteria bacterium]|nr:4Fe-4S binding protein [candidate division Zixibacteria bacterium]
MGHMVGKDIYRKLGKKIDGLTMRAPWNDTLYRILKELYSAEEAELIVKMPYGMARLDEIEKVTGYERGRLQKMLESLCSRGLVMDVWMMGGYRYMISPMVIGIFEFTMMRTGSDLNSKEWARLFHEYLQDESTFYSANFGKKQKISPLRALPYEETIDESEYVEVLDYEKATSIIEATDKFAIGICSCRHEKMHLGKKECDVPLRTCSTFGGATDYLLKRGFAETASKTEMLESLARSRELGLVLCADNIKKHVSFICHCCGCCCNILLGISRFGYPNTVVTSTFIASHNDEDCTECGNCVEACPIEAIAMVPGGSIHIDTSICMGCGVCALKCATGSVRLVKRKQRVLHPETTFERILLQCLERGTLQNLIFSNPQSITDKFMRGLVGGFLRLPPVKKALMSDALRSSFLETMAKRA